jgi:hypothetical protein
VLGVDFVILFSLIFGLSFGFCLVSRRNSPQCRCTDIFQIFSVFGTLQSCDIRGDQAFVNYYASAAAERAMSELGSESFRANPAAPTLFGKKLQVRRRTFVSSNGEMSDWLRADESIRQANDFFGFGCWGCEVTELQELETVEASNETACTTSIYSSSPKEGKTCFTMEMDEHYCDVIIKRWEDYTGNKAEKI